MKNISHILAGAAIAAALGIAAPAAADPFADAVEVFIDTGGNGADPGNATGATDAAFAVLGDGGSLVLRFTDNTCLAGLGDDVSIADDADGTDEDYAVTIGLEGETLGPVGTFTETSPTLIDVGSAFTRIGLTDQNQLIGNPASPGAEIDSVECLNSLAFGTDHIDKTIVGDSDITETGPDFDAQQSFTFEITIENPDGADLSGLTFRDTVPAEFDIVAAAADNTAAPVGGGCTLDGAPFEDKKGNQKLAPDRVSFTAALEAGESCTVTVDVATDDDHPGRGNNPDWTPTTCPVSETLALNDGVEVLDSEGNLIFRDDSTLALDCTDQPPV